MPEPIFIEPHKAAMAVVDQDHLPNLTTVGSTASSMNYDEDFVFLCSKTDSNKFGDAVVPIFFYVVFTISLLGNGLILFLLLKFENIKTVTNLFIFNLVVSDLLFTVSLPFWAYYHSYEWIFGDSLCKVVSSMFYVGFYSSILFLTMMTIDRYMAVVHAIYAARTRKLLYVYLASAVIWVTSLLSTIPKFILYGTRDDVQSGTLCVETGYQVDTIRWWKMVGYCQQLLMFFLIPLAIILYCYTLIVVKLYRTKMHNKDKAVKLILIIVLAFFVCWTPFNAVLFIGLQNLYQESQDGNCSNTIDYVFYVCRNIAYFHCCVNPFFYTFVGTKFRGHLASLFGNWLRCGMRYRHPSLSSKTSEYSPQTIYE
ncbi:PREDICTED: C-C chemokine receptor type 3-like [Nanorana parkeri]|uniref:C-C chemokine receptor type 3-like n=1 Tax=Nanorana parkeri TaxID=125878 RepID=UPI000854085D|nr:PREDICTED: C-C chemokine receptor type 3-like [Nanorana parkeri]